MGADFSRDVHCVLGLPFDAIELPAAIARVRDAAARRAPCLVSTANVNFVIGARNDSAFRASIINSDLSVADGMPLVWIARLLGVPIRRRVSGSTLFESLRSAPGRPLSVYFYGGPAGVAASACARLNGASGALSCAGYESPGFGSVEALSSEQSIERINAANADFLVVSLGAKKGQAWIARNRARLRVPVISHLGAVLHFAAGTVRRAPAWVQHLGLEWLWRIKEEPALWRRYWNDGLALLGLVVTRVLPHAWHRARSRHARAAPGGAQLEVLEQPRRRLVRLRGTWSGADLAPLRECFARASASGKTLAVDLGEVGAIDSALVGLLVLLHGDQAAHGRTLLLPRVAPAARRIIRYCCAEYLYAAPEREAALELEEDGVVDSAGSKAS